MAKKSIVEKWKRPPKFKVRAYTRCHRCGRPRGYLRDFGLCRICFRELALSGQIPGQGQLVSASSGRGGTRLQARSTFAWTLGPGGRDGSQ